jgi:hypothetical protein
VLVEGWQVTEVLLLLITHGDRLYLPLTLFKKLRRLYMGDGWPMAIFAKPIKPIASIIFFIELALLGFLL